MPYLELGRNNIVTPAVSDFDPTWIADDASGKVLTADDITPDQGFYGRPILNRKQEVTTPNKIDSTDLLPPLPIDAMNSEISTFQPVFDASIPLPPSGKPQTMGQEEVVMVVPTAMNANIEITSGFILIGVIILSITLFSTFVYFGYKQYKAMLSSKATFTCNENPFLFSEKSKSNTTMNYPETATDSQYQFGYDIQVNKPLYFAKPQNTYARIKENGSTFEKMHPHIGNSSTTNEFMRPFKNKKVHSMLSNIKEFEEPSQQECENPNSSKEIKGLIPLNPLNYNKVRQPLTEQNMVKRTSSVLNSFINSTKITMEGKKKSSSLVRSTIQTSKGEKIRYSHRSLIDLEPVETYQRFQHSYFNDGNILVTDMIFPTKPLEFFKSRNVLEEEFTKINVSLMHKKIDPATKSLEVLRFIVLSFGLKQYDNPIVYTPAYNILVQNIIDFKLLNGIENYFLKSAFIETIVMYFISCWKSQKVKEGKFTKIFQQWRVEPVIPKKLKIFENVITLLLQGYRKKLLEEVLTFFIMPPSPHLLQNVLSNSLKFDMPVDTRTLLEYLKRNVERDHYECCANLEKLKQWELATGGYEFSKNQNVLKSVQNRYPSDTVSIDKSEENAKAEILAVRENYSKLNAKKTEAESLKKISTFASSVEDVTKDENFLQKERFENKEDISDKEINFSDVKLNPNTALLYSVSSVQLPGSLSPSPINHSLK